MLEMRMVLITLYSKYNTHLVDNKEYVGFTNLTLHPEGGLFVKLEKRVK